MYPAGFEMNLPKSISKGEILKSADKANFIYKAYTYIHSK